MHLNKVDERIWTEELSHFVPQEIFDVHTHIFRWDFHTDPDKHNTAYAQFVGGRFHEASWEHLEQWDQLLFPGRSVQRLSFGFPFPECNFQASNEYVANQVAGKPGSAALMLVDPKMDPDEVEETLQRHRFIGFKPYRLYSLTGDPVHCRITDFLPESLLKIADRQGLLVMMHLSRKDAIGDELNLRDLQELTDKYPRVRWILAHCARSYSCWAIDKAAPVLQKLKNIWYDTSSVCETDAIAALYHAVGPERVMYGSDDLPVGVTRGKYVTFGYAWAFLSESNHALNLTHCDPRMTFTRYEQLRAMYRAGRLLGFDANQTKQIFHDNAAALVNG